MLIGDEALRVLGIAGVAAAASLLGGMLALAHRPSTLISSIVFGFAGGALVGTVSLEMTPRAVGLSGLGPSVAGFGVGFAAVYAFDLFVHRGVVAGEHAQQRRQVEAVYRRKPPRGGSAFVLAAATSAEEIIEGLAIGVGAAVEPSLALIVGFAIAVDNVSEGMSIAELFREEAGGDTRGARRAAAIWTAAVGVSLFGSALLGWLLLRGLPGGLLGWLLAAGAGAMLYLTLSDLLPEGQERHFQQSSAVAAGTAFALILALSTLSRPA